jgi:pimeloyl-ACP methyl ester carboxylesterase
MLAMASKTYAEELVHIEATDGIELAGAVIRPIADAVQPLPIVWIHGFTGRFYEPHALAIGRRLAERGHVFVTGNNRGNNYGTVLHARARNEERLGGAAWERLDESPRDIAAWIEYTIGLGFPGVALVGHSLGGMKSTYYMATEQDPRVKGLVNASGPVWRFIGPGKESVERQALAERMVDEGRGLELLLPFAADPSSTLSAQAVDGGMHFREVLFGQNGHPPAVALLRCPVFAFVGSEEAWLGTPDDLAWFKATAVAAPRCETRYFEGADHLYTGHEREVADAIGDWVAILTS